MKITKPKMNHREYFEIAKVLRSGNLTQGKVSRRFEDEITNYIGGIPAFVTSSATTGLHLALDALKIGAGDEVIIPDFSFPATANAVIKVGAIPVAVDILLSTYCIDPAKIEEAITSKTKAIMPVHAFGLCANMPEILEIAQKHDLFVIEDAACALGATIQLQHAGTFGDCGVFSFHPRKIVTTGEGGAIVSKDAELMRRIEILRSHGAIKGELYLEFIDSGFNFRLSDISAAIGVAQMTKLRKHISDRIKYANCYKMNLELCPYVALPSAPDGYVHTFQSYVIRLSDHFDRDEVIRRMKKIGIETTLGTYSISSQPYFQGYKDNSKHSVRNSEKAFSQSLTLPLYPGMGSRRIKQVTSSLVSILTELDSNA